MQRSAWANQSYTLSFLSERPLRHEMDVVLPMLASGRTWLEVRRDVLEQNLFHVSRPETARTHLKLLRRRLNWLEDGLRSRYLDGNTDDRIALLLCSFLAAYRLPREFVLEEIRYRWQRGGSSLSKDEVTEFFQRKREQNSDRVGWSDKQLARARQVITRQLCTYHLLERAHGGWHIRPVAPSDGLRRYLAQSADNRAYLEFFLLN
ncbi:MAG: DUF1819 family protein [Alicyclobacillus sp.]|nr:DUF1819 family protein [Alicyclobacillus sp.]